MKVDQVEGFPVVVDFADANIVDVEIAEGEITLDIFSSSKQCYFKARW